MSFFKKYQVYLLIPILFISCSNLQQSKDSKSQITITINSPTGTTVMNVDEETKNIMSSCNINTQTNVTTNRVYTYGDDNNLRSIYVEDTSGERYTMDYGDLEDNQNRSVMSDENDIPKKVQKVTKTLESGRAVTIMDNTEPDTIEYYYDEDGKLGGIFRIDEKNNVFYKGAD